jgi:hypothetical protein
MLARVRKQLKDKDGKPFGIANSNPILNTRVFNVEFVDGYTVSMTANAIAEHLFLQVDSEGSRLLLHTSGHDYFDLSGRYATLPPT